MRPGAKSSQGRRKTIRFGLRTTESHKSSAGGTRGAQVFVRLRRAEEAELPRRGAARLGEVSSVRRGGGCFLRLWHPQIVGPDAPARRWAHGIPVVAVGERSEVIVRREVRGQDFTIHDYRAEAMLRHRQPEVAANRDGPRQYAPPQDVVNSRPMRVRPLAGQRVVIAVEGKKTSRGTPPGPARTAARPARPGVGARRWMGGTPSVMNCARMSA